MKILNMKVENFELNQTGENENCDIGITEYENNEEEPTYAHVFGPVLNKSTINEMDKELEECEDVTKRDVVQRQTTSVKTIVNATTNEKLEDVTDDVDNGNTTSETASTLHSQFHTTGNKIDTAITINSFFWTDTQPKKSKSDHTSPINTPSKRKNPNKNFTTTANELETNSQNSCDVNLNATEKTNPVSYEVYSSEVSSYGNCSTAQGGRVNDSKTTVSTNDVNQLIEKLLQRVTTPASSNPSSTALTETKPMKKAFTDRLLSHPLSRLKIYPDNSKVLINMQSPFKLIQDKFITYQPNREGKLVKLSKQDELALHQFTSWFFKEKPSNLKHHQRETGSNVMRLKRVVDSVTEQSSFGNTTLVMNVTSTITSSNLTSTSSPSVPSLPSSASTTLTLLSPSSSLISPPPSLSPTSATQFSSLITSPPPITLQINFTALAADLHTEFLNISATKKPNESKVPDDNGIAYQLLEKLVQPLNLTDVTTEKVNNTTLKSYTESKVLDDLNDVHQLLEKTLKDIFTHNNDIKHFNEEQLKNVNKPITNRSVYKRTTKISEITSKNRYGLHDYDDEYSDYYDDDEKMVSFKIVNKGVTGKTTQHNTMTCLQETMTTSTREINFDHTSSKNDSTSNSFWATNTAHYKTVTSKINDQFMKLIPNQNETLYMESSFDKRERNHDKPINKILMKTVTLPSYIVNAIQQEQIKETQDDEVTLRTTMTTHTPGETKSQHQGYNVSERHDVILAPVVEQNYNKVWAVAPETKNHMNKIKMISRNKMKNLEGFLPTMKPENYVINVNLNMSEAAEILNGTDFLNHKLKNYLFSKETNLVRKIQDFYRQNSKVENSDKILEPKNVNKTKNKYDTFNYFANNAPVCNVCNENQTLSNALAPLLCPECHVNNNFGKKNCMHITTYTTQSDFPDQLLPTYVSTESYKRTHCEDLGTTGYDFDMNRFVVTDQEHSEPVKEQSIGQDFHCSDAVHQNCNCHRTKSKLLLGTSNTTELSETKPPDVTESTPLYYIITHKIEVPVTIRLMMKDKPNDIKERFMATYKEAEPVVSTNSVTLKTSLETETYCAMQHETTTVGAIVSGTTLSETFTEPTQCEITNPQTYKCNSCKTGTHLYRTETSSETCHAMGTTKDIEDQKQDLIVKTMEEVSVPTIKETSLTRHYQLPTMNNLPKLNDWCSNCRRIMEPHLETSNAALKTPDQEEKHNKTGIGKSVQAKSTDKPPLPIQNFLSVATDESSPHNLTLYNITNVFIIGSDFDRINVKYRVNSDSNQPLNIKSQNRKKISKHKSETKTVIKAKKNALTEIKLHENPVSKNGITHCKSPSHKCFTTREGKSRIKSKPVNKHQYKIHKIISTNETHHIPHIMISKKIHKSGNVADFNLKNNVTKNFVIKIVDKKKLRNEIQKYRVDEFGDSVLSRIKHDNIMLEKPKNKNLTLYLTIKERPEVHDPLLHSMQNHALNTNLLYSKQCQKCKKPQMAVIQIFSKNGSMVLNSVLNNTVSTVNKNGEIEVLPKPITLSMVINKSHKLNEEEKLDQSGQINLKQKNKFNLRVDGEYPLMTNMPLMSYTHIIPKSVSLLQHSMRNQNLLMERKLSKPVLPIKHNNTVYSRASKGDIVEFNDHHNSQIDHPIVGDHFLECVSKTENDQDKQIEQQMRLTNMLIKHLLASSRDLQMKRLQAICNTTRKPENNVDKTLLEKQSQSNHSNDRCDQFTLQPVNLNTVTTNQYCIDQQFCRVNGCNVNTTKTELHNETVQAKLLSHILEKQLLKLFNHDNKNEVNITDEQTRHKTLPHCCLKLIHILNQWKMPTAGLSTTSTTPEVTLTEPKSNLQLIPHETNIISKPNKQLCGFEYDDTYLYRSTHLPDATVHNNKVIKTYSDLMEYPRLLKTNMVIHNGSNKVAFSNSSINIPTIVIKMNELLKNQKLINDETAIIIMPYETAQTERSITTEIRNQTTNFDLMKLVHNIPVYATQIPENIKNSETIKNLSTNNDIILLPNLNHIIWKPESMTNQNSQYMSHSAKSMYITSIPKDDGQMKSNNELACKTLQNDFVTIEIIKIDELPNTMRPIIQNNVCGHTEIVGFHNITAYDSKNTYTTGNNFTTNVLETTTPGADNLNDLQLLLNNVQLLKQLSYMLENNSLGDVELLNKTTGHANRCSSTTTERAVEVSKLTNTQPNNMIYLNRCNSDLLQILQELSPKLMIINEMPLSDAVKPTASSVGTTLDVTGNQSFIQFNNDHTQKTSQCTTNTTISKIISTVDNSFLNRITMVKQGTKLQANNMIRLTQVPGLAQYALRVSKTMNGNLINNERLQKNTQDHIVITSKSVDLRTTEMVPQYEMSYNNQFFHKLLDFAKNPTHKCEANESIEMLHNELKGFATEIPKIKASQSDELGLLDEIQRLLDKKDYQPTIVKGQPQNLSLADLLQIISQVKTMGIGSQLKLHSKVIAKNDEEVHPPLRIELNDPLNEPKFQFPHCTTQSNKQLFPNQIIKSVLQPLNFTDGHKLYLIPHFPIRIPNISSTVERVTKGFCQQLQLQDKQFMFTPLPTIQHWRTPTITAHLSVNSSKLVKPVKGTNTPVINKLENLIKIKNQSILQQLIDFIMADQKVTTDSLMAFIKQANNTNNTFNVLGSKMKTNKQNEFIFNNHKTL